MNPTDRMMSWAQIVFTALLLVFTFVMILIYELNLSHLTLDQAKTLERWGDWLTGASFLTLVFWFQRQRTGGIPDNSQVVTQVHTAPDGSKTTVTSPANAPASSIPTLGPPSATKSPLELTPQEKKT